MADTPVGTPTASELDLRRQYNTLTAAQVRASLLAYQLLDLAERFPDEAVYDRALGYVQMALQAPGKAPWHLFAAGARSSAAAHARREAKKAAAAAKEGGRE